MKLAISNIGWSVEQDECIYSIMQEQGFEGLEIAPTRIYPETPYDKIIEASAWAESLKAQYGFVVPSMQSIWFGRQEKLFGTDEERDILVEYTKKAIDFAAAIGCRNLVFGCPRNRVLSEGTNPETGIQFFRNIGAYAAAKGTVIGIEANPPIYNTNYINDTASALRLIKEVDSPGFKLNLDVGTMIHNNENVENLKGQVHLINHVHISEPGLKPIERREMHLKLKDVLLSEGYDGFVSIEMGKADNVDDIKKSILYVKGIFNYR